MGLVDRLLDEKCEEITLKTEEWEDIVFEQVAVIPREEALYCILKPKNELDGVNDDEAIVFRVDKQDDEEVLVVEDNEEVAMSVFEEYLKLWDEANGEVE